MSVTPERLERARQLLRDIHHIPLATVNDDGTPHNTPVFMAFDDRLQGYWASHRETRHSRNIIRDGRVFLVVFDSREGHGGVYIEATAVPLEDLREAERGLGVLRQARQELGGTLGDVSDYSGYAGQRIYRAEPLKIWVNQSERNGQGVIIRDRRYAATVSVLMKQGAR